MEDPASSPSSSAYQLDSPSASTFLRTAQTLEGLAKQLENLEDGVKNDTEVICCCGGVVDGAQCEIGKERRSIKDKLKLSGEIGSALLQRCELLERKYRNEMDRFHQQLEVKRTALAESVKRVHNLEKANMTHMQKYTEQSRKMEVVEKRYAEAMHTQTLTQQSLTHVRTELTNLRSTHARQTVALASRGGVEEKLLEAEKRYEEARDMADEELRKSREEKRKRLRAEARIAELEEQVKTADKEAEKIRADRAQDAQDLLANARERLKALHDELSETYNGKSPSETPEYQRILEDLVANNTLLKHDASELSGSLAESRDEVRVLRDEIESLRASIPSRLASPIDHYPRLAHELNPRFSHSRTESSPIMGWNEPQLSSWEHHRKLSTGVVGLGMGPIGETEGSIASDGVKSGPVSPIADSPKQGVRASPGSAVGYMLNGVPKRPGTASRRVSGDSRIMRNYALRTIGSIDETLPRQGELPVSPSSGYFRAAEISRKRRSLRLARQTTVSSNEFSDYSPNASNTLVDQSVSADFPSPMSETAKFDKRAESPHVAKRRTLLLLTKSMGVQTDPIPEGEEKEEKQRKGQTKAVSGSAGTSRGASPTPGSESFPGTPGTPSPEDGPASALLVVVEHMSRILSKLRSADVPTLNKRLKRQHLAGDVVHLSQTTLRALQQEINEVRHHFRGIHNFGTIDPRDFNLLLRLLRDVFNDLVELQAVVNDVTITPAVAKKLQRAAYKAEEDEAAKAGNVASGLGWIAAPITKFFVTAAENTEGNLSVPSSPGGPGVGLDKGRPPAMPGKPAPKQQAMASATATHVSVEFGGSGMVRRVAPALTTPSVTVSSVSPAEILSSPSEMEQRAVSGPAAIGGNAKGLAPPTVRTLRSVKSKANRNELLGIFAGAPPRATTSGGGANCTVVKGVSSESKRVNNQAYDDHAIKEGPPERKKLSSAVDAVIDQSAVEDDYDSAVAGSYEPPLLERQLRPRGLSDSSIRSTTVSLAKEAIHEVTTTAPIPRATAYGTTPSAGSVFQTLSRRFYSFRAPELVSANPAEENNPDVRSTPPRPATNNSNAPSPPRAILRSSRGSSRNSSISTTSSLTRDRPNFSTPTSHKASTSTPLVTASSSQTRYFGYFTSSLEATGADRINEGMEGEEELVGGNLRQGGMLGHARIESGKQKRVV
ncbi:hypothetical protein C361_01348 [Cryptococcus neoformans Tu259-1]|uniref:Uncharacterized protein n=1 Tax=Cryptococcus neoformans Tu259-1 TaxID=1230072 RepID=A0A854QN02_CRYNE|nr:hypothetical protein C361_01348 [Cryptococcus neoformans var. grubii Tu259-1]